MPRAAGLCLLAAGLGAAAGAPPASATTTSRCHASALELSLLGSAQAGAITAGGSPCVTDRGGADLNVLGAVRATAVEAATDRGTPSAPTSAARIAGLEIGVAGFSQQLTAPLLSGPGSLLGQLNTGLTTALAPGSQLTTALAPLKALGLQVVGLDTEELLRGLGSDLPAQLQATLPSIVEADLITASAAARCISGAPQLRATTDISGLHVLGAAIDPDDPVTRTVTLDSAHLTLAQLVSTNDVLQHIIVKAAPASVLGALVGTGERSLYDLLTAPGGVVGVLNAALPVGTTLQTILDGASSGLAPVITGLELDLPTDLLQAKVTPHVVTNDGRSASATTLALEVTLLGEPILSGALANASITTGAADCGPGPAPIPSPTPAAQRPQADLIGLPTQLGYASLSSQLQLQCGGSSIRLIDVHRSGRTTLVRGVAKAKYVGRTLDIVLAYGDEKVGQAKVRPDGSFAVRVPLPPASIRDTNDAFYFAQYRRATSNALKFTRRMEVAKLASKDGMVTMKGRTTLPRSRNQKVVVLKRRVTCSRYETVGTVRPDRKGRFSVTFKAPSGVTYAIFRAETRVPKRAGSTRTFETYTLPRLTRLT